MNKPDDDFTDWLISREDSISDKPFDVEEFYKRQKEYESNK